MLGEPEQQVQVDDYAHEEPNDLPDAIHRNEQDSHNGQQQDGEDAEDAGDAGDAGDGEEQNELAAEEVEELDEQQPLTPDTDMQPEEEASHEGEGCQPRAEQLPSAASLTLPSSARSGRRITPTSRLPVPRKLSASDAPTGRSARGSPLSRDALPISAPTASKLSALPKGIPTIQKRPGSNKAPPAKPPAKTPAAGRNSTVSGRPKSLYIAPRREKEDASTDPQSTGLRTPKKSSFGLGDVTGLPSSKVSASTTTSLAGKRQSMLLELKNASSLQRKTSGSQLPSPTSPRRPSGVATGATASSLAKQTAPSQAQLSKRVSSPALTKKPSSGSLASPPTPAGATPLRRSLSSGIPSPHSTTTASTKLPVHKPTVGTSGLSQPSSTTSPVSSVSSKSPRSKKSLLKSPPPSSAPESPGKATTHRAASQSLRETIAKARAAHRAANNSTPGNCMNSSDPETPISVRALGGFNFETDDPFNQAIFGEGGSVKVLKQRIKTARFEGRLNISNMELKEIPEQVYKMYETTEEDLKEATDGDGPKWYESVDLVKVIAADNELEMIGEELVREFGGLTSIDMHNNLLKGLPLNFTELTQLKILNLSNNKLDNSALNVIVEISSLVDLKLSKNSFTGKLDSSISKLANLEILELQENQLTSLPASLGELSHLHLLNIAQNQLVSLPFESLKSCPLHEISAANNKLRGALFPATLDKFEGLQILDIKNNNLSSLSEGSIVLPSLQQLLGTNNVLSSFPSLEGWTELLVLTLDSNRLDALPDGLFSLHKIRTIDFSANGIKSLDARLGAMESLEFMKFDGNPLRERQLVSMSMADLKRTLKGRLAPPEIVIAEADEAPASMEDILPTAPQEEEKYLQVGRGDVLDLNNKGYEEITKELMDTVIGSPATIEAIHNKLTVIPACFDMFAALTTVNLSHNKLSGESYLTAKICLTTLTTLILQTNVMTTIKPILEHLDAPKLETLDVSCNRIVCLQGIRQTFPVLTTLYARDNAVEEIPVESVDGIRVLDLSSNCIAHLPPKLGLVSSIRELRVSGNTFRVPKWQVLEKGTECVLEWLRDRLPVEESEECREESK